jgi:DNA-binding transcriptional ArsR family regulator
MELSSLPSAPAPVVPHPLPPELVELVALRFRLLGEPMRIRLLDLLRDGERSVGELALALGASQQNVSKHLGALHHGGIVRRRKAGNRVVYAIDDASIFQLCEIVCGGLQQRVAGLARLLEAGASPGG